MSDVPCVEDRLLSGPTVDRLLDSCRSRKYALMKRPFDPFPSPLRVGRSSRWLASLVFAWINRQAKNEEHPGKVSGVRLEGEHSRGESLSLSVALNIQHMKQRYEAGYSLDQLCREFRIGKARLSEALRAAGAQLRKPGRSRSISTDCVETASVPAHRVNDPFGRTPASSEVARHGY
jgi:predicted DNA-binding transcriptional regulator AlpA